MGRNGLLLALVVAGGCVGDPYGDERPAPEAAGASAKPEPAATKPSFVAAAPSGDVAAEVRARAGESPDHKLVVYVGASWCGPCQEFHAALERGELDQRLKGVTFLEFDADRDSARLAAAGYGGRLIPRFALPDDQGRFGGQKIEGGIKGQGSVVIEHIMQRLEPLLRS